jgi:hypothetical protein
MKKLSIALLLCFVSYLSNSQDLHFRSGKEKNQDKPQLFSKEASRFSVRPEFINQMLSGRTQQQVTVQVSPKTTFNGKVTAITHDAPGLETIIMHSSEVPGLVLSISRLEIPGKGTTYSGVMISRDHRDLLMMEKDPVTGQYLWNKKEVSSMILD